MHFFFRVHSVISEKAWVTPGLPGSSQLQFAQMLGPASQTSNLPSHTGASTSELQVSFSMDYLISKLFWIIFNHLWSSLVSSLYYTYTKIYYTKWNMVQHVPWGLWVWPWEGMFFNVFCLGSKDASAVWWVWSLRASGPRGQAEI